MSQEQIASLSDTLITLTTTWGIQVVGGIIVLILGWVIAGWSSRKLATSLEKRSAMDATLIPLVRKITRILVLAVVIIAVLNQFGVQTASLIAVLGAAGLAIGLSLQGALGNIASGVLLLSLRPFEVGDIIEVGGHIGTVREIGLFATELRGADGVYIMLGNSRVWGSDIKNFGRNETRRIDMVIGIGYGDDIDRAIEIVHAVIAADTRVLKDPEPLVAVGDLGDSSVDLLIRPWTASGDWWATQLALRKAIKQRFDAEGISIPFPQRDIHMIQAA